VIAVLLGIFLLHERPQATEFAGMGGILVAVFLLTTAKVAAKVRQPGLEDPELEDLANLPAE
jgi:drug/metabolite transporter (DMT)-like permease